MSLSDQIILDLKEAMKSGDDVRKGVLRMLKSQIRNKEIELGDKLSENDEIQVLNTAVKSRRESIEFYKKGDRLELMEKEAKEIEIVQLYLPKALSSDELAASVDQVIFEFGASSAKDFGRVMKEVMSRNRGRVDGKQVQEIVRAKLA